MCEKKSNEFEKAKRTFTITITEKKKAKIKIAHLMIIPLIAAFLHRIGRSREGVYRNMSHRHN